ncbi:MAG: hypothetical protein V1924_02575, partial [Candidatus Bathyarchaeota archaeon]
QQTPREALNIPGVDEIRLSKTGNGKPVIALEQEGMYLDLQRTPKTWSFTVRDFRYPPSPHCTFTVRLDTPQKLITSKLAKTIRDTLQTLYRDHHQALNRIIQLIQQHDYLFTPDLAPDEENGDNKESPAEAIVRLAEEHNLILFRDQFTEPGIYLKTQQEPENRGARDARDASTYIVSDEKIHTQVCVNNCSHNKIDRSVSSVSNVSNVTEVWQVHRLRTRFVSDYLSGVLYRETGKVAGKDQMSSAISVLSAKAQEKPQIWLWNRVAPDGDGGIWLDMSNDRWEAIHVTRDGWEMVSKPPVLFRRYPHQKPMIRPAPDGNLAALLSFTNLSSIDDQLLYLAIMIHYLIPGVPHIGIDLWGTHGSVKSTQQRIIKDLIDPSSVGLLPLPKDLGELIQQLDHHYLAFYDNVTGVNNDQSDTLCRGISGIGHQKRALYTDDEAFLRELLRCVNMNGINVPADNPDLLNRFVVMECPYLPEAYRRPEKELKAEFNLKAPEILGAMLDTVVKALSVYPQIENKIRRLPRMADATLWCCAITEALGIEHEFFLNAYRANIGEVEVNAVRSSPIGEPLLAYLETVLETKETVTVTTTQLLTTLKQYAEAEGQDLRHGGFPPDSTRLSKELNKIKSNLPKTGYHVRDDRGDNKARRKVFTRIKSSKLTDDYTPAQNHANVWKAEDLRHVLDPETYRRDGSRKQGEKQVVDDDVPERRLPQDEDAELAAESIQRDEPQSLEGLESEPAEAEIEASIGDEASHAPNVQDLYDKAEKAAREGRQGGPFAWDFWDALEKLGHPRKHAEYPLKDPKSPVEFVGLRVRLKEAKQ